MLLKSHKPWHRHVFHLFGMAAVVAYLYSRVHFGKEKWKSQRYFRAGLCHDMLRHASILEVATQPQRDAFVAGTSRHGDGEAGLAEAAQPRDRRRRVPKPSRGTRYLQGGPYFEATQHFPGKGKKTVCVWCKDPNKKVTTRCMYPHCSKNLEQDGVPLHLGECWVNWHNGVTPNSATKSKSK